MTFSESLALRVLELERERTALRRRVYKLERSNDLWKRRYRDAMDTSSRYRKLHPLNRVNRRGVAHAA